jgi:hypothetical protein
MDRIRKIIQENKDNPEIQKEKVRNYFIKGKN